MEIKCVITFKYSQHLLIHLMRQPIFTSNTSKRNYFKTINFIIVNPFMHFTRLQMYANAKVNSKIHYGCRANSLLDWKKHTRTKKQMEKLM